MLMPGDLAVISDIHSNREALEAVLADVFLQHVSQIICLGDIVGYASGIRSCLKIVQELGCPVLLGNHDEAACLAEVPADFNDAAKAGVLFSARRLKESDRTWLKSLPLSLKLGRLEFTHASLAVPRGWHYVINADDALAHFSGQTTPMAFCGHTHKPGLWWQKTAGSGVSFRTGTNVMAVPQTGRILINAGSVGQPRDGDPRACYVLYRPDRNSVEFRRVAYDIKRTRRKILRAGLPRFTAQRLSLGR